MSPLMVVDIGRESLVLVMLIAGPMLIAGLVVGLAVGLFQAVTQIHEMTLTFIPKIIAITLVLLALLPWMIVKMVDYTIGLFNRISTVVG
jgi:flagellar biosynthetic protein FliQ